jgi:hypothetical protein
MTLTRRAPLRRTATLTASPTPARARALPGAAGRTGALATAPRALRQRARRRALDIPDGARATVAARSGGRCELGLEAAGCTGAATDVHHRQRRREGGHAVVNLLHLCRGCHTWVTEHPAAARELGAIVSVYADPATTPAYLVSRFTGRRERVRLLPDGGLLVLAESLRDAVDALTAAWADR